MPLTEDFTYLLDDNGVVLNTSADMPPFVDILKISGFDSAEVRLTQHQHEGTDGGFADAEFEQSRTIALEGVLYSMGQPMEPYLDALKANWAPRATTIPLYFKFPDVSERLFFIKPLGCRYDYNQLRRLGSTEIQFTGIAEDPRAYDAQLQTVTIDQGDVIVTGRSYPRGYPYGYGAPVVPNGASIYVSGNRSTPPTITIPGPVKNFQIINDTTGDIMVLDATVLANETMTVDMLYRSITINGQNRRATLREPNWFFLSPGNNYLRFRAESSNTTVGSAINSNVYFETENAIQGDFESSIGGYTGVNATAVWSTAQAHSGTGSAFVTPSGSGVVARVEGDTTSAIPVVFLGQTFVASAWVMPTTSTKPAAVQVTWRDANFTFLSSSVATATATPGVWQFLTVTANAPSGAVWAEAGAGVGSSPTAVDTSYVDELKLTTTGWIGSGGTVVRSTTQAHEGSASLLLTPDGISTIVEARTENIPVTPGAPYYASAWVRCAVARSISMSINWRDASATLLSQTTGPTIAVSAGVWTNFIMTSSSAPSNAAYGQLIAASLNGTPPTNNTTHIDEAIFAPIDPSFITVNYRSAWR